jgi:tripartite-type tricarboxylate transporter receptor subunit TctC
VARLLADKLSESFGRPVVVENVTGAAGNIAADHVAKAKPDGYTIGMLAGANVVINAILYKTLPYDPVKDLIPVSLVLEYANVLVIGSQIPAKSVTELVALAKAEPGKLSYGHNGVGTTSHLSGELLKKMADIDIQEVPYRGLSPMLSDLYTGRVTMTFNTPSASMPLVRDGKLRALAVTSLTRVPYAPELPTMDESGFPGLNTTVWFGIFAPAGTPKHIADILNREVVKILARPEFQKRVEDLGLVVRSSTSQELAQRIAAEAPYWARIIKDAGVKPIE